MYEIIDVCKINKQYKILKRNGGILGSIRDLFSKNYSIVNAVSDLSFTVKSSEIVGFLGPNGSGKSTTIKMMTGIIKPTSGKILINGIEPYKHRTEIAAEVGVVFGQRTQLWWSLPVKESLKVIKEMYGLDDITYKRNIKLFERLTNVKDLYDMPVRQLSLGQRTLCEILATFLHNPKIVFLDEPTIGLDISVKEKLHNLITELNRIMNTTVIVTSHDMSDIEAMCNRVIIINKGEKIYDCNINELKVSFSKYRSIRTLLNSENDFDHIVFEIKNSYESKIVNINRDGKWVEFIVDESEIEVCEVLEKLCKMRAFTDIAVKEIDIENIIKKIYEGNRDDSN